MTRMPALFVFDWDGTLADSAARIVEACTAVFLERGWPTPDPERVKSLIGLSLEQTFAELVPQASSRDPNRAARRYRELWALGGARPSPLFAGASRCLTSLRQRGALVAVATGKGRRGLDSDLHSHQLRELVAASRCADETQPKPAPDMLLEIMEELDVPAGDVLMIGDTTFDMEMAKAAGVARLGVRSGVHEEPRLRSFQPVDVIDSVGELVDGLRSAGLTIHTTGASELPMSPEMPASMAPSGAESATSQPGWEREAITRLAFASLKEQRSARRWGVFFKIALMLYLVLLLALYLPFEWPDFGGPERHTALVDIDGAISASSAASADRIATGLRAAFEDSATAAVILRINSPGGSPVQAGYVNDEIRRLRKKYPDIPVYAVVQDMCASGGYYIAAAADKIYADKASVVGSIGVLMSTFGFVDAMQRLGIERRVLTAGEHKALLDPFLPMQDADVTHMKSMLATIHQQFIDVVREGRGERLAQDPRIFSGLFWTGVQAVELGLVDALGSAGQVARDVVGEEEIVNFTVRPGLLNRLTRQLGIAIGGVMARNMGEVAGFQLR